jgi:hypothetical protein
MVAVNLRTLVEKLPLFYFSLRTADMNRPYQTTAYLHEVMTQWRHDFHAHPELGCDEQRTAATVAELLRE